MALIKDKIKSAENKELLKNPLVRGMLNTIRYAEGTAGEDGYNTRVGGGKFSDLSKKPGKKIYIKSIGDYSSAEGAFQILNGTWASVSKDLGLTDFSPESQDIAAVELIKRRGALNDILNGNFEIAVNKLSPEWASLPKSDGKGTYKNQKAKSIQQLSNIFYKNVDYNSAVKPYINTPEEQTYVIDTPEISNLVTYTEIPNLAESNETEAVQKAKEELDYKQQQQINQQRFIQDLLAASQVQYLDPNQVQQEDIYNQEQYFQKGGLYYDLPMNNPNTFTPEQFTQYYINSPKYRERLINSGYINPDKIINDRLNSANSVETIYQDGKPSVLKQLWNKATKTPYSTQGSAYDPRLHAIIIDSKTDESKSITRGAKKDAIKTHELGHAEINGHPLSIRDEDELINRQKSYKVDEDFTLKEREIGKSISRKVDFRNLQHDLRPEENKSDLNALRYILKQEGIYDAGKENFTKEHLKKLKPNFFKNRLLKNYNEEDLIWLMNNIAQTDNQEDAYYAQNGGSIGNLTPQQTADVESQRQWLNEWNKNRVINGVRINTNSDIPFSSDIYIDDLNYNRDNTEKTLGEFDTVSDRLILDPTYQSKTGIPVHEFSHRYQKYLDPSIYNKYINEPISTALKNTQGSSEYHGNVDENQAELNRLRYNSGFKPNQIITPKDIQSYNPQDYNLKHFSQEQLINLLNKTAYNDTFSSQAYAQNGGEIIKDDNGYWNPNNWGKVVEINSNDITMSGVSEPLIGIGDNGISKLMLPGKSYIFEGAKKVTEYPLKRTKNKRFS